MKFTDLYSYIASYRDNDAVMEKAKNIVQYTYYFLLYIALIEFFNSVNTLNDSTVIILYLIALAGTFLGTLFYQRFIFRFLVFISFALFCILRFNNMGISSIWFVWLMVTFLFTFLPVWRDEEKVRIRILFVIWIIQAVFAFVYFLSGLGKLTYLSDVYGLHVSRIPLIEYIVPVFEFANNKIISSLSNFSQLAGQGPIPMAFFITVLLVELYAGYALLHPKLQRVCGASLILIHIIQFILFRQLHIDIIIFLALFYLESPFQKSFSIKDLPLFRHFKK